MAAIKRKRLADDTVIDLYEKSIIIAGKTVYFKQPIDDEMFDKVAEACAEIFMRGMKHKSGQVAKTLTKLMKGYD